MTPASERPTTPAPALTDAEAEEIREHDAREMFLVMGPSGLEKIWTKGECEK